MIPHIGRVKHDPPYSYGDCLRAVIASMFEVDRMEDVPHFIHDGDDEQGMIRFKEYLWSRGFRPFYMAMPGTTPLNDIFAMMAAVNTNIEYLLFCRCTDADHVVLCKNDQVIHDPAWVKSAITGPSESSGNMWVIVVMVGEP